MEGVAAPCIWYSPQPPLTQSLTKALSNGPTGQKVTQWMPEFQNPEPTCSSLEDPALP